MVYILDVSIMGRLYLLDGVSLIEMKPSLHADTWDSLQSAKHQSTRVTVHCRTETNADSAKNIRGVLKPCKVISHIIQKRSPVLWGKLGMSL